MSHKDMLDIYATEEKKNTNELSPLPGFNPLPVDLIDTEVEQHSCPICKRTMAADANICVGCGYDNAKGIQSSTQIEKTSRKGKHRLMDEKKSQGLPVEYHKPLAWFLLGFVLTAILRGVLHGPADVFDFVIKFGITVPALMLGLWICEMLWLGKTGTVLLSLVRLSGALALFYLVDSIMPFSIFFVTPGFFVFCVVLMDVFDIEFIGAMIVAILMGVMVIISRLGGAYLILNYYDSSVS